jgi:hypothetical protein
MYLQNIMSDYLNETKKFEVDNTFRPVVVNKSEWSCKEKRLSKSFEFTEMQHLQAFVVELLKYDKESTSEIEVRFRNNKVGIIIHAISPQISEIELEAAKDVDKIKKDVIYYYAK